MCLEGTIPDSIEMLQNLTRLSIQVPDALLDCKTNESVVTFPSTIGSLGRLEELNLAASEILGKVPLDLGSASSLRVIRLNSLYFSTRSMKGSLPPSICNLTRLETLELRVGLEGFSDSSCLHWPNLRTFDLNGCSEFRWHIDHLNSNVTPRLEHLNIGNTKLSGDLAAICTLSQLKFVSIHQAVRFKTLPDEFWNLEHLESISIADNVLEGSIGAGIGRMKNLSNLWIADTNIGGTIPPEIGLCESLHSLHLSHIPLEGSLPSTMKNLINLRSLTMSGAHKFGEVPTWLGSLKNLETLTLSSLGLTGSIPASLAALSPFTNLDLSNNYLSGFIPEGIAASMLVLSHNSLTGTLPPSIINTLDPWQRVEIDLSHNRLGRSLRGFGILSEMTAFRIDLSSNNFHTRLPQLNFTVSPKTYYRHLILYNNRFYGPIPTGYNQVQVLRLDNNILNGNIDFFFTPTSRTSVLQLSDNHFNGSIPDFTTSDALTVIDLSRNDFDPSSFPRSISSLPPSLYSLSLSGCSLTGNIPENFAKAVYSSCRLETLDLSSNLFTVNSTAILSHLTFACGIKSLNLAHNLIKTNIDSTIQLTTPERSNLESLVLSYNFISFGFPFNPALPRLQILRMDHNRFTGSLPQISAPMLSEWDVSYNNFSGAMMVSDYHKLTYWNASHNRINHGIYLDLYPRLQTLDLSSNEIDARPDLASLSLAYTQKSLIFFSIANNSLIPTISEFSNGLNRTSASFPSATLPGVVCYNLAFNGLAERLFIADEKLFEYQQCDCDLKHFGLPSLKCLKCPVEAASSCGRTDLFVQSNTFLFKVNDSIHDDYSLQVEDCMYSLRHEISGKTNCLGVNLSAQSVLNSTVPIDDLLAMQCSPGSEGRLCSRCKCNSEICYFSKAEICLKCSKTFHASAAISFALGLPILAIIVLTIVFYLILRSKRDAVKEKDWSKLSLFKRIFYRIIYFSSLGTLSIVISFIQILLELTSWNWHILQFLNLMNGGSIGLQCVFPFLSDPLVGLIAHFCLPLILLSVCAVSIGLAEFWWRRVNKNVSSQLLLNADSWHLNGLDDDMPPIRHVHYPATALLTSVSISIVKFFYFGTALAAHTYLFHSTQPYTKISYVQNIPWMRYNEAFSLILASIPAIIIFDLVIPVSFAYLCYRVRHSYRSNAVRVYFGSLFETFSPACFWWEIILILRKLSIALVKQGFTESDALQPMIISTVVLGVLIIQVTLKPWRRSIENFADTVSAVLLIGSMLASRSTSLAHSSTSLYYAATLDVLFVLFCVVTLIFEASTGKTLFQREVESQAEVSQPSLEYTKLMQFDMPSDDAPWSSSSED